MAEEKIDGWWPSEIKVVVEPSMWFKTGLSSQMDLVRMTVTIEVKGKKVHSHSVEVPPEAFRTYFDVIYERIGIAIKEEIETLRCQNTKELGK